jgi:hypothetical protein
VKSLSSARSGFDPWLSVQTACAMKPHLKAAQKHAICPLTEDELQDELWTEEQRSANQALRSASRLPSHVEADPTPYVGNYSSPFAGVIQMNSDWSAAFNEASGTYSATSTPDVFLLQPTGWYNILAQGQAQPFAFVRANGPGTAVTGLYILLDANAPPAYFARNS